MSAEAFTHDVFLSHSSKDKAVVRALAERLRQDGLKVWFDEWVLKPGEDRSRDISSFCILPSPFLERLPDAIPLPQLAADNLMSANRFRIAFSFAGEKRDFVSKVARL
jgi:hypothetical protein